MRHHVVWCWELMNVESCLHQARFGVFVPVFVKVFVCFLKFLAFYTMHLFLIVALGWACLYFGDFDALDMCVVALSL